MCCDCGLCHHPKCEELRDSAPDEPQRCHECGKRIRNDICVDCCGRHCERQMHPACAFIHGDLTFCSSCFEDVADAVCTAIVLVRGAA